MELWIRTQDKMKLFRGIDIRIVVEQEGCSIIDNTDDYIIGTYKTKERALEVLNEIQSILMPPVIIKNIDTSVKIDDDLVCRPLVYKPQQNMEIKPLSNAIVYEMPEE